MLLINWTYSLTFLIVWVMLVLTVPQNITTEWLFFAGAACWAIAELIAALVYYFVKIRR